MIFYLAHPVAPTPEELAEELELFADPTSAAVQELARQRCIGRNVESTLGWFRWIVDNAPGWTISIPWLAYVSVYGDDNGPMRERGLRDMERAAARHDGIILVNRLTSGMDRERAAAMRAGKACISLLDLGPRPPTSAVELLRVRGGGSDASSLLQWRLREALGG